MPDWLHAYFLYSGLAVHVVAGVLLVVAWLTGPLIAEDTDDWRDL